MILLNLPMQLNILIQFLIAIALGALFGIERQRGQKSGGFAGFRTFIMITFLGALTGYLYQELDYPIILPMGFIALSGLIIASYIISAIKGYLGITAEVSAYICYILGFMIMFDQFRNYALIFGVILTIILSYKSSLHTFIEKAKEFEWNDTLKFALIAFVILPLLPKDITLPLFDDPKFADLNVFHPREIWLLVVFVSGISFVGYYLIKLLGNKRGVWLTGALGGIVSSTAVTQSMASHSKTKVKNKFVNFKPFATAAILATMVSFIRVAVISISINRNLISILIPITILVAFGVIVFLIQARNQEKVTSYMKLESPFKLKPALVLGGLYALLTFLSKLSYVLEFGKSGIVIGALVTGFFDIDPVILTVSSLSATSVLSIHESIAVILIAVSSNQLTKSFIALSGGSKGFGKIVSKVLLTFIIIILGWVFYLKLV